MACGTTRTCLCGLYVEGKHKGKCRQCFTKPKYLPAQRSFEIEALLRASEAKKRKQCNGLPGSCSQDDLALTVRRSRSAERCDGSRIKLCASPGGEFGTPTMRRIINKGKVTSSESCSTPLSCSAILQHPPAPPLPTAGTPTSSSSSSVPLCRPQSPSTLSTASSSATLTAMSSSASSTAPLILSAANGGVLHHAAVASLAAVVGGARASVSSSVVTDPMDHIYETIDPASPTPSQQSKCASSPPPPYDGSSSSMSPSSSAGAVSSAAAAAAAAAGLVGVGKRASSATLPSSFVHCNSSSSLIKAHHYAALKPGASSTLLSTKAAAARLRPPRLPPSYDEVELAGRLDSVSLGNPHRGSDPGKDIGSHHVVLPARLQQGISDPKLLSKEDKAELKRLIREVEAEEERKQLLARIAASRRVEAEQAQGCSCSKCQRRLIADPTYYSTSPPYNENDLSSAVFPMETQVLMQDIMTDGLSLCSVM